eukprot:TRINITY_DN19976_c0_g1_i1.p2 TRINITY_DN19976_c0_g1~~TRINITY_DN19976_c0_g1_i1.p2  ORF type:complete len:107 (+),score=33.53 TRINITY_DN19976_c0_g1_i1:186-506(+)
MGDTGKHGWVLDGFPVSAEQAQSVQDAGLEFDKFIQVEVDVETLVARLSGNLGNTEESVREKAEAHQETATAVAKVFKLREVKITGSSEEEMVQALDRLITGAVVC